MILILCCQVNARQIARGVSEPMVERENDKPTVLCPYVEIAEGLVTKEILNQPERELPNKFHHVGIWAFQVVMDSNGSLSHC